MKTITSVALAGLVSCLAASTALSADYRLALSTSQPSTDPMAIGMEAAKKAIEERSDGQIEVTVYPSSQLGSDNDVLEQIRSGAPIAVLVDAGRLAPFEPALGILTAPYLVNDYSEYAAVTSSPLFQEWADSLAEKTNLRLLDYNWFQGTRQMFTRKEINTPEDLNGVRVRTIDAPGWVATIDAMGATPAPMAWSEVYSALQLGAIDGAEAQLTGAYGIKLQEVTTNVALTNHIQLFTGLVTSDEWFQSLPEDLQVVVSEELKNAGDMATEMTVQKLGEVQAAMEDAGVKFNEVDISVFRDATSGVYEEMGLSDVRDALAPYLPANN